MVILSEVTPDDGLGIGGAGGLCARLRMQAPGMPVLLSRPARGAGDAGGEGEDRLCLPPPTALRARPGRAGVEEAVRRLRDRLRPLADAAQG